MLSSSLTLRQQISLDLETENSTLKESNDDLRKRLEAAKRDSARQIKELAQQHETAREECERLALVAAQYQDKTARLEATIRDLQSKGPAQPESKDDEEVSTLRERCTELEVGACGLISLSPH